MRHAGVYIFGFGALYFAHKLYFIVIMAVIWTFGEILTATNIDVFIANHTPSSHRGRVKAVVPILLGLGFSVSPAVMGWYVDLFSARAAWPVVATVATGATAILGLRAYAERGRALGGDEKAPDCAGAQITA